MRMLTTASGVGRGVAGSSYDERVPTSRGFGPRLHWNVPHGSREILGVSSIMTLRDVDGGRSGVATSGRTFAADGVSLRRALARWSDLKPSLDMFPTACARASSLHIGTAGWLPAAASGPGPAPGLRQRRSHPQTPPQGRTDRTRPRAPAAGTTKRDESRR